jgi:arsenate reductase
MIKPKVLFLCTENSCRTQMAEALLRDLAGHHFDVVSAGGEPGSVDPEAIAAMRELDIEISGHRSKDVAQYLGQRFTFVITLCDRRHEKTCPIFPGAIYRQHWNLENPALVTAPQEHRAAVRRVRDQLQEHVQKFVGEHQ